MKQLTGTLALVAVWICGAFSTSAVAQQADFTLSIQVSEALDSKVTFISEDEEDFITRSITAEIPETTVLLRSGVKYALTVRTDSFVPKMQEFIISESDSKQNFMHLDLEHLKDASGKIIAQQAVAVYPYSEKTPAQILSKKTQEVLESVRTSKNVGSLVTLSETLFYMTADDYRMKVKEEGKPLAQFDENSIVKYLYSMDAEVMASDSYEELIPSQPVGLIAISTAQNTASAHTQITTASTATEVTEKIKVSANPNVAPALSVNNGITEEKLFFTVQLGAFSKQIKNPERTFNTNSVITQGTETGQFKYYSGVYYTYEEANAHKERLSANGAQGVFVAAFNRGERVTLSEAIGTSAKNEELE